jgi:hypothetical protein
MGWFSDITGGLFGGSSGAGDAEKKYMQYMQQAMSNLQAHEQTGRTDITGALNKALGFGEPYREAGKTALGSYMASMGLPGGTPAAPGQGSAQQGAIDRFTTSPGYQFALNSALGAVNKGAAASGFAGSGAEQKELQQRASGLADLEYGQYQGRLANLAGMGQEEAGRAAQMTYGTGGELAQLGLGYSGQETGLYGEMGQAEAEAEMAKAADKNRKFGNMGAALGALAGFGGIFGTGGITQGGPFGGGGAKGGMQFPAATGGGGGTPGIQKTPGVTGTQGQQQQQGMLEKYGPMLAQLLPFIFAMA